ncbi:phosphatase PAP2 family protein [Pseudorhodoplanes sinuspersici]|uniref:phosphatase PAP2 family protein n=1 Tax=Pseudorhodoplanes sinuspersici TaxID=1235591 RepID=UPI000FF606F3|nr:phosphatase PAP2 family protein [Pseudorhodoplanes sinuspersici]RKE73613.1 undecaprenyl-diphosphatase [Pseudorhodoplanes sinuspersici]
MYQGKAILTSLLAAALQKPRRAFEYGCVWPTRTTLLTSLIAFIVCIVAVKFSFDAWSVSEARHLPRWLVNLSGQISWYGKSGWLLWPIAGLLLVCLLAGARTVSRFDRLTLSAVSMRLTFLLVAVALPGLLAAILKPLIGRARPFALGQDDVFLYVPFAYFRELLFGTMAYPEYVYGSMPSGHATNAFAIAIAFGALWPRLRPLLWTFAVAIATTRLIIVVHHPTDVLVGAAIGTLGALAIRNYFAARRWVFAVDATGHVYAKPGPQLRDFAGVLMRLWRRPATKSTVSGFPEADARARS